MKPAFFSGNRQRLTRALQGGLIVVSGYTAMQLTNDMAAPFRQESNFWWLTGIETSDWSVIIDGNKNKTWLVAATLSSNQEIFDGSLSATEAAKLSGITDIISQDEAKTLLRDLARHHSMVYTLGEHPYAGYLDFTFNPAIKKNYDMLDRMFNSVQDCRSDLTSLRSIKQPEEIVAIKKAISLTNAAFSHVKDNLATYIYEYEIEAAFSHYFRSRGASGHAYDPIVAGSKNACTLHYTKNSSRLSSKQSVLIDIGASVDGYCADITRTYSVQPTKRIIQVHAAVQRAQQQIIASIKPNGSVKEYHHLVDTIMRRALLELGLIKNDDKDAYRRYFPHAISHGLGVDVHDNLGAPMHFKSGMVLTVEPGIYIPEEKIGVRLEDDILVTEKGHTNLSGKLSTDL